MDTVSYILKAFLASRDRIPQQIPIHFLYIGEQCDIPVNAMD